VRRVADFSSRSVWGRISRLTHSLARRGRVGAWVDRKLNALISYATGYSSHVWRDVDRWRGAIRQTVEAVERSWAGLRSFAPDRVPVYGFDADSPSFFWCVGQGGFGIQTAPAASGLAASLLLGLAKPAYLDRIDARVYSAGRFQAD